MVGHEADLQRLQGRLQQVIGGARQISFVTGEAGVGKTTLGNRFLQEVAILGCCRHARLQCVKGYGTGSAYLPVLEAIDVLYRGSAHGHIVELLQQWAPT